MKATLVSTVKDAGPAAIQDFLASLAAQTRPPDEVVIVDGGSSDGTLEALRAAPGLVVVSDPGANIARGRNLAIAAATHDVIAVTDADCTLAPDWLERLLVPLERGADVSAGFYRPVTSSFMQDCIAATNMPDVSEIGPGWMPSSRSVAFTRRAVDLAGGYPEWLAIGEDMYLNHRWVALGLRIEPAPDAVVYWRLRPTLGATWRQYAAYARGDGEAGMYPRRHAARFAAYGFAGAALALRSRPLMGLTALGGLVYAWRPLRRGWRRLSGRPDERLASLAAVPLSMAFIDVAKMWGYAKGIIARSTRQP